MPLELSGFPVEVQMAFFIYGFLEDNWDGMNGTYMGKVWTNLEYLCKVYKVQEPNIIIYFMKLIESTMISHKADKANKKQKAEERRSASGGKTFTHNVKG